jgi:hypothetical protein
MSKKSVTLGKEEVKLIEGRSDADGDSGEQEEAEV